MSTPRHLLAAAIATLVVMTGCGQDDTATTGAPGKPAPAAPAKAGPVAVSCVATWTQGTTGTFTCAPNVADKTTIKVSADNLHLDKICISDERLTTYGFGGTQTAPITATGTPPQRCADLGGVTRLPENCVCVPPAGGDCASPAGGKFICLIIGHVG